MLDEIAEENGERMADLVLAYVRKGFDWYEVNGHDDDFRSPVVRGMARTKPKERKRKRVLADDEIRDLWEALDAKHEPERFPECFPCYVKSLLLCATRRNESALMHTREVDGDLWTIPGERYKNKLDHVIPLTARARALIGEKPKGCNGNSWFVFTTTGGAKGFSGFSKAKRGLDAAIAEIRARDRREPMPAFTLHDLRRSARSLMSRAKVPTDHAERALGHVMGGVRETYDLVDPERADPRRHKPAQLLLDHVAATQVLFGVLLDKQVEQALGRLRLPLIGLLIVPVPANQQPSGLSPSSRRLVRSGLGSTGFPALSTPRAPALARSSHFTMASRTVRVPPPGFLVPAPQRLDMAFAG